MKIYAKLVNGSLEFPPKNKDNIINYRYNIEKLIEDGYKEVVESEKPTEYCEEYYTQSKTKIFQKWRDITEQVFIEKKAAKFKENEDKAEEAEKNGAVQFKEAFFETNSNTASNLMATLMLLQATGAEEDEWLTKDDKTVILRIEDFQTLGSLIKAYKSKLWKEVYMGYKKQIQKAATIEELDAIKINYALMLMMDN